MPIPVDLTLGKFRTGYACKNLHVVHGFHLPDICPECGEIYKACILRGKELAYEKRHILWFTENVPYIIYEFVRWREDTFDPWTRQWISRLDTGTNEITVDCS